MSAKKPKLTKWFDGLAEPVRNGVYQRKYANNIVFSKWKDDRWYMPSASEFIASKARRYSKAQFLPWRGLAQNPEEKS